ncbi:MAG: alpha-1,4-glucan--maltose-1-phosphate maltosyltransferase [Steroidobacteraceae bacterium]
MSGRHSGQEWSELPEAELCRVVVEDVSPAVDGGRFPIKRTVGESVVVEADVFADGHDAVACDLLYRGAGESHWRRQPMEPLGNDRWRGVFVTEQLGTTLYSVAAWVDPMATWRRDLLKRAAAGQDLGVELLRGAELVRQAATRATGEDARRLRASADRLADARADSAARSAAAQDEALQALARRYPDPLQVVQHDPPLAVDVDRERARNSSWYEMFPRSAAARAGTHGTFTDCEARLPYIAAMGFDVLYLPPVHPIGTSERKGPRNEPSADAADPGSPWAIGSAAGGHLSLHAELGSLADFRRLVARAAELGIEIALDIAFQCSPDHPYVREHPEWFLKRPDGSIQYAENPPKKYQDIYPFYFETSAWRELWQELARIVEFWLEQGVRIFRVDNPHTKPFAFWQWLIARVRRMHPEVIFLAEAFTRPDVMYRLAKAGFTQSYTYFTWRNTRQELISYFTELGAAPVRDFFRPSLWPNTPDILPEYLQFGGRPAFAVRLVLAATLGANYGIYGPAFELMEHVPREPGSEEYLDSEKYQLRHWDLDRPDSLRDFIARINRIRRENQALQSDRRLVFHACDNQQLIVYSKTTTDLKNAIVVVANLDPHNRQSGWVELDLTSLGLDAGSVFEAHDLLSGSRFTWQGSRNFVLLDPAEAPAHILRLRQRARSERDFDYFQ